MSYQETLIKKWRMFMVYDKIPTKFNVSQYLLEHNDMQQVTEEKIAFYYKDKTCTYGELQKKVNQCANYYRELGIVEKNRVGIYMHDCPELVYLLLGAMKAGIVPVIVNPKMTGSDLNDIAKRTELTAVFTDSTLLENIQKEGTDYLVKCSDELDKNLDKLQDECKVADTTKDDAALILFTSGSSGIPKGAVHRHYEIAAVVETFGTHILDVQPDDIFYTHSKMSFAFGLGGLYIPLAKGASLVINGDDNMYDVLDIVETYHVTKFQAVPSVYLSVCMLFEEGKEYFTSCKVCTSGGEPLPKKLAEEWKQKTGLEIYQGYGSTEMLNSVISNGKDSVRYGSMGKAIDGYTAHILNDDGEPAKAFDIGTLYVQGESIMEKYWDNEEMTQEVLTEHGINTGDMCYFDKEGYIWYAGRNSDIFKVNGAWQSALPIEDVILEDENVKEVIVTNEVENGVSSIVAYIVAKELDGCEEFVQKTKVVFFQRKMRTLCPKKYYFVEAIPRGNTGKVKRGIVNTAKVLKKIE